MGFGAAAVCCWDRNGVSYLPYFLCNVWLKVEDIGRHEDCISIKRLVGALSMLCVVDFADVLQMNAYASVERTVAPGK